MKENVVVKPLLNYPLQEKIGGEEVELELKEGESLKEFLVRMCRERNCQDLVFERGKIKPSLIVLLNQRNINLFGGEETELCPGDEITLVPAIAGG